MMDIVLHKTLLTICTSTQRFYNGHYMCIQCMCRMWLGSILDSMECSTLHVLLILCVSIYCCILTAIVSDIHVHCAYVLLPVSCMYVSTNMYMYVHYYHACVRMTIHVYTHCVLNILSGIRTVRDNVCDVLQSNLLGARYVYVHVLTLKMQL